MATIPAPDLSATFLAEILVPLIVGFLVGIVAKAALKIALAIVAVILVLLVVGFISPGEVIAPFVSLVKSGPAVAAKVQEIAGFLPYSSLTFVIGVIVGFFKG